jgi:hypothetical protein
MIYPPSYYWSGSWSRHDRKAIPEGVTAILGRQVPDDRAAGRGEAGPEDAA